MSKNGKMQGFIEEDMKDNTFRYDEYKKERKKNGFVSPKAIGILIWDETKVSYEM